METLPTTIHSNQGQGLPCRDPRTLVGLTRRVQDVILRGGTLCITLVLTAFALAFLTHISILGVAAIDWEFLTTLPKPVGEIGGGIANAIVGTVILLVLAALIGCPIGILGALFLSEFSSTTSRSLIRFFADVLNGVPAIIWGIVVYGLLVIPLRGFSALAGGIVLGLMMVPSMLRAADDSLRAVPQTYREAATALGAERWRIVCQIVLPLTAPAIVRSVVLVLARFAGETAPLLFTAFGNRFWNYRLTDPIAAVPLQVFTYAISPYDDWHRQAWAGALLLIVSVTVLNLAVRTLPFRKTQVSK